VSGLPGGWGGALGLAAAHGVDAAVGMLRKPSVAGTLRLTVLLLFRAAGLAVGYLALGLRPEEKDWLRGLLKRGPRPRRIAPRATELREDRAAPAVLSRRAPAVSRTAAPPGPPPPPPPRCCGRRAGGARRSRRAGRKPKGGG